VYRGNDLLSGDAGMDALYGDIGDDLLDGGRKMMSSTAAMQRYAVRERL
jgi:hypothetical protein